MNQPPLVIFTVGHSTRSIDELTQLLRDHGIRRVVDVRSIPRSRHNPQFNRLELSRVLRNRRIHYRHMKNLGGLRHARKDSPNAGWRNASFRGFADYMQSPDFEQALSQLIHLAAAEPTAIMCAEAVPWRCHRSLIADALLVRGIQVFHIYNRTKAAPHALTSFAKVHGSRVIYPEASSS